MDQLGQVEDELFFVTSSRSLFNFSGDAPLKGRISIELSLVQEAVLRSASTAVLPLITQPRKSLNKCEAKH
jgi:hypothetical protein